MNSPADSNTPALEPRYEEQFTAFVDFLGFSEASTDIDEETRLKVLALLQSLTTLRSEFAATITENPGGGTSYAITPAISTFSDHIVVSYPWQPIAAKETQETIQVILTLGQFQNLLAMVAAAALEIGFLIRGGATVGRLYHANGVVFGEALVEASSLEARTAIYPRVVLSNRITERWGASGYGMSKDFDGLYYVDYMNSMIAMAGMFKGDDDHERAVRVWFESVVPIISRNLTDLEWAGKLRELAKWTWFARKFREAVEKFSAEYRDRVGISTKSIPWLAGRS